MSPDDDRAPEGGADDRSVRAAEIALGLVSGRERALAADPALRGEVEAWEADLAGLIDELPSVPPRDAVWSAIRAAMVEPRPVSARTSAAPWWRRVLESLGLWRGAAAAGWATALGLLLFVSGGAPDAGRVAPRPLLVSSLLPRDGGPLYVVTYDVERARLIVVPAAPVRERGRVAQLWLVPNDTEDPIALAPIGVERTQVVALTSEQVRHAIEGAGLVITLEPDASPNPPAAQGPVVAHGRLARA